MSLATMPDPSYLGFEFSSLTHITSISFIITTYLHVILFACLPNCFVGGVLIGGLLSRLSLFFLMISSDLSLTTIQDLNVLSLTTTSGLNALCMTTMLGLSYLGLAWLSGSCVWVRHGFQNHA